MVAGGLFVNGAAEAGGIVVAGGVPGVVFPEAGAEPEPLPPSSASAHKDKPQIKVRIAIFILILSICCPVLCERCSPL